MTDNQNADRPWDREALLQIISQSKYRRFFWIISMIFFSICFLVIKKGTPRWLKC